MRLNDTSIMDFVIRLTPPVELGPGDTPPDSLPGELIVELASNSPMKVSCDHPAAIAFAYALEFSRRTRSPLKLVAEDNSELISRITLALVSPVKDFQRDAETGFVKVRLELNQAIYLLDPEKTDFEKLVEVLEKSRAGGTDIMLVGRDGTTQIEDVIDLAPDIKPSRLKENPPDLNRHEITKLTESDANSLMQKLHAISCDPRFPSAGCIPFLFPDHGCEARAHAMSKILANWGITPGKLWVFGDLELVTNNYPTECATAPPCRCFVGWGYHVAPFVMSRDRPVEKIILDPSVFLKSASESEWFTRLDDQCATRRESHHSVFFLDEDTRKPPVLDPLFINTGTMLFELRVRLCLRAWQTAPPPYAHCLTP